MVVLSIITSLLAFLVLVAAFAIGLGGAEWGQDLCYVSGLVAAVGAVLSLWAMARFAERRFELVAAGTYAVLMNLGVLAGSVAAVLA